MSLGADDPAFDELPPSAKYVYHVVQEEGPIRRQELIETIDLPERTVARAVKSLHNGGYLLRNRDNDDLREVSYHIGDGPEV